MRNIIKSYADNSSIELVAKMLECGELSGVLGELSVNSWHYYDYYNATRRWTLTERECISSVIGKERLFYNITDYSCVVTRNKEGCVEIKDWSDEWTAYLVKHLPTEHREKYLQGLQQFADNVANALKQDVLNVVNVEQTKIKKDIIDLSTSEERLIKKQIEAKKAEEEKRKRKELEKIKEEEREKEREDAYEELCKASIKAFEKM